MKIYQLLPVCSLLFFVACGEDSSSVIRIDPETTSSSDEIAETSSSFEKGKSSSSVKKKSSSSSAEEIKSSSSKAKVSSSSEKVPTSSSSANVQESSSSADVALTDPIEIFKPRVPKAAAYHCSVEDRFMGGSMEIDFDSRIGFALSSMPIWMALSMYRVRRPAVGRWVWESIPKSVWIRPCCT